VAHIYLQNKDHAHLCSGTVFFLAEQDNGSVQLDITLRLPLNLRRFLFALLSLWLVNLSRRTSSTRYLHKMYMVIASQVTAGRFHRNRHVLPLYFSFIFVGGDFPALKSGTRVQTQTYRINTVSNRSLACNTTNRRSILHTISRIDTLETDSTHTTNCLRLGSQAPTLYVFGMEHTHIESYKFGYTKTSIDPYMCIKLSTLIITHSMYIIVYTRIYDTTISMVCNGSQRVYTYKYTPDIHWSQVDGIAWDKNSPIRNTLLYFFIYFYCTHFVYILQTNTTILFEFFDRKCCGIYYWSIISLRGITNCRKNRHFGNSLLSLQITALPSLLVSLPVQSQETKRSYSVVTLNFLCSFDLCPSGDLSRNLCRSEFRNSWAPKHTPFFLPLHSG